MLNGCGKRSVVSALNLLQKELFQIKNKQKNPQNPQNDNQLPECVVHALAPMEAGVPQDRDSLVEGKLTKALRKAKITLPAALQPPISRPVPAGPQLCSAEPLRTEGCC